MPAFWNSWALWEKLVFSLGSAIVVVIILGCVKLLWNQWRLRKYVAIAATKATLKQNMQHSQSVRRGKAREVPFGVRALENGVEVEGVWISGTNTPAGSTPGTPTFLANANSARGEPSPDRASSASTMSHLEMPPPTRGHPTAMIASDNHSQDSGPFADLRVSSDSTQQQRPTFDHLPHRRPSYKPPRSSQLRYSNSFKSEDPESLAAREGNWLMPHGKGKERQGSESEYEEQGHFPGRYRHHGMTEAGQHASQIETNSPTPEGKDPFATPPHRPSDGRVPVFHIDDDSTEYPMMNHDGTNEHPTNAKPLVPVNASEQLRRAQIIRKVNSGFQILAPGTFDTPIQGNAGGKEEVPGNKRQSRKLQKRSRPNSYSIEEP